MITFIASPIGSGKSCFAAKIAIQALKKNRKVYSTEYIEGCFKINIEDLSQFCCPNNSLIIIDETGNKMNSRKFATIDMKFIEFLKLSRHYKNDLILISQTFDDTDKQARNLSHKVLILRVLIPGILSMIVNCPSSLTIDTAGDFKMSFKIGKIGSLFFLPKYFKYFNSFEAPQKDFIKNERWNYKYRYGYTFYSYFFLFRIYVKKFFRVLQYKI